MIIEKGELYLTKLKIAPYTILKNIDIIYNIKEFSGDISHVHSYNSTYTGNISHMNNYYIHRSFILLKVDKTSTKYNEMISILYGIDLDKHVKRFIDILQTHNYKVL